MNFRSHRKKIIGIWKFSKIYENLVYCTDVSKNVESIKAITKFDFGSGYGRGLPRPLLGLNFIRYFPDINSDSDF